MSVKPKLQSNNPDIIRGTPSPINLNIGLCNISDIFFLLITVLDTFFLLIISRGVYISISNYELPYTPRVLILLYTYISLLVVFALFSTFIIVDLDTLLNVE